MMKNTLTMILVLLLGLQCYEAVVFEQSRGVQSGALFKCTGTKNEFTCGNSQCIPSSAVCNGLIDCQDGSDEDDEHCTVIQTGICSGRKRTKNFCDDIPNRGIGEEQNVTNQFFCHSDILKKDKSLSLLCANRVWTPTTTLCTRICEPLTLSTSSVTCSRNGIKVDCDKPLLVGTKIYPQCEFYYRPSVKEIVCQGNGEWSEKTIQCTPECGRQFKDKMRYTREMRSAEFREFPWSAAIYYKKPGTTVPILIPGTIISPYLIVTTAINFYSDYQQGILTTESVNVVVAKRTKELEATDDQFQKSYKVQGIYFTDTGFQNSQTSLSSENIAMIELDEKLVLSPSVYPACVNWEKNETLYAKDEDIGQVPHTLTLHEANSDATTQHEILQTLALRFVSRDQCLNTDSMKSIPYVVRTDNFCGEPVSAPAPCDGAFIFLETNTNRFYVQGLVDGITPSLDTPPLFTNTFVDLSAHVDWMNAVRKTNEDRLVNNKIRLEFQAVDSSLICTKSNDVKSESDIDVRFANGKERRSEMEAGYIFQHPQTETTKSSEECLLPLKASLNANNYSISCPVNTENNACRRIKENSEVPEYTSVKIGCKKGFAVNKSNEEAICFKGQWNPVLSPCTQHCDKLPKFENGNFTCYEEEQQVKCTDDLKIGSKLVPQCNAAYKTERDIKSSEFVCQDDGKWVGVLPKCVKKSAKEATQSPKSSNQQTKNQNGSPQAKANQSSLQPRSPSYAPSNSGGSNRTSPNSRDSIQAKPGEPQAKTQNDRINPKSNENADSRSGGPPLRRPQAEVQVRNESGFPDGQTENENGDNQNPNHNEKECSKNELSCGNLCIPYSAMCNGTIECEDGTDESPESCKILSTDACTPRTDPGNYCDIQVAPDTINSKNRPSKEKHSFLCNAKYMENVSEGIPLNCVNGVSTPSTIPCIRICKNVTIFASGLDCYRNDELVDCKKPLLSGTTVVPRCESEYKANFNETTCNEKGEWDYPVIECIPECGKLAKKETKMTKTIRPAQFREFPWNVAVYKKARDANTSVLFAGIIISPSLVLTNAHCCANEMANGGESNMDMFEVVVAKRSSTSDVEDDDFQKYIKVKTVHLMENSDSTSERLAIVELAEKITSCPAVQPACVNWDKNETVAAKDGTLGLVPHWRTRDRTNSDTTHEMLQAVAMTLHNREACQKRVHKEFLKYLTKDAFCVESIPTTTPAHRGAGFIYQDQATKLNYVQGVTYFTGTQEGQPTTFTNMFLNITTHIDWINSVRRKTEKRLHREWILNTRVVRNSDVCKSQNDTNNENGYTGNESSLSTRSGFAAGNKPDDFVSNGCELPDKTWLYLDYNVSCLPSRREKECKKVEVGAVVPEFASLTLSCNEGYVTNGSEEVVCFRKNWSPAIEPCRKICDKLELENVTLKCFWEDKKIDCDGELKSGTTAIVECAPYHQSEKSLPKLLCDEYGHWKGASEVACSYFNPWNEKGEYFKYSLEI